MGGPGSGNSFHWWRGTKKEVVEDCLRLDANRWMREDILRAGVLGTGSWRWTYPAGGGFSVNYQVDTLDLSDPSVGLWYSWLWTATKEEESAQYRVRLTTTRPRFGGLRWWFICPLIVDGVACRRRVGKLYLPGSGRYFGCRHCHNLTYTSCQESRKYDGLFRRLAANTGMDFQTVKRALNSIGKRA